MQLHMPIACIYVCVCVWVVLVLVAVMVVALVAVSVVVVLVAVATLRAEARVVGFYYFNGLRVWCVRRQDIPGFRTTGLGSQNGETY